MKKSVLYTIIGLVIVLVVIAAGLFYRLQTTNTSQINAPANNVLTFRDLNGEKEFGIEEGRSGNGMETMSLYVIVDRFYFEDGNLKADVFFPDDQKIIKVDFGPRNHAIASLEYPENASELISGVQRTGDSEIIEERYISTTNSDIYNKYSQITGVPYRIDLFTSLPDKPFECDQHATCVTNYDLYEKYQQNNLILQQTVNSTNEVGAVNLISVSL